MERPGDSQRLINLITNTKRNLIEIIPKPTVLILVVGSWVVYFHLLIAIYMFFSKVMY